MFRITPPAQKMIWILLAVFSLMAMGLVLVRGTSQAAPAIAASASASTAGPSAFGDAGMTKVLALVGSHEIRAIDVAHSLAQGVDAAIALDRAVKAEIAAQAARQAYPQQAQEVGLAAQRVALSQLYVTRRGAELAQQIGEQQIRSAYEKYVPAADYMEFRVDLYSTQDPREAEALAERIARGEGAAVAEKFKPLAQGKFVKSSELPYGLPQVLVRMKAGQYSRPLVLRTGVFIVRLNEVRQGQRPLLEEVQSQLKDLLVAQQLDVEMQKLREKTRIVMK